ncbi:MAG: hypothetical protein RQ763_07190 [Sulfurimonas sp.]|uniref:hypothetical protein n=1 Tax=Sulfurimonas sp. TaxID=2022749 RepID=UPI0028CE6FC0|nr:hypothetical protein [Sulfurimonas sp.]MDT8338967.1 hypothetical protein [Sulfurimonas sp.]
MSILIDIRFDTIAKVFPYSVNVFLLDVQRTYFVIKGKIVRELFVKQREISLLLVYTKFTFVT